MNENQVCGICRNNELNTIFNGNIRDGSYGKLSSSSYKVFQCSKCKVRFLDKFVPPEVYESGEYRKDYCGSNLLEVYRKNHDELWNNKLHRIGIHNCRDKSIADFGAGGGAFLDALQGVAKETIAIEPTQHWQESLSKKHRVFSYGKELVKTGIKINIGVSFDVIEHVAEPRETFKEFFKLLKKDGILLIYTPNANSIGFDYMMERQNNVTPPIHLHYFNEKSINKLGEKSFSTIYFKTAGLDMGDIYAHERDNGNKQFSHFLYDNYQVLQTFFDHMDSGNHLRAIFKKN